mgnify:CR=1 FL=1
MQVYVKCFIIALSKAFINSESMKMRYCYQKVQPFEDFSIYVTNRHLDS